MTLTVESLRFAVNAIATHMESHHTKLTELDGQLGDGDLGITLLKAFRALQVESAGLPDDLGAALSKSAVAVTEVSSSSFGTLLAVGLLSSAKSLMGRNSANWTELSGLVAGAVTAMSQRGKASLGDKTVLDVMDATSKALAGIADPKLALIKAREATDLTIQSFRGKPNRIGRARMFAERSMSLDDPGMVAFSEFLEALESYSDKSPLPHTRTYD